MIGRCASCAPFAGLGPILAASDDQRTLLLALVALAFLGIAAVLLGMWRRRRDLARSQLREQWLGTILRSIGDGVIATDAAGRVTFMNNVAQELTGWTEEEATQKPLVKIFQTLNRETRLPAENPIDLVVREGRPASTSEPALLVARDGAEHAVLSIAAPIRDADGGVTGVVFVVRDVTQRELAEAALRDSQEMFRLITDNSPDFITILDLEGRRLYSSASYATILAPPGELYLKSAFDCIYPEDRERVRDFFVEVVRTGIDQRTVLRVNAKDGRLLTLEAVTTLIRNKEGRPEKVLVVSRDITERQQAEERVRRETIFSDTLINSMPGIFYLYDARRKILRWNKNLETVTGYSAQEIDSLDPLTYFPDEEKPVVHERMLKCFAEGTSDIEVHLLAKDGRRTPYYVTGFRLEIDGRPCMLGLGIDITARRTAEKALRETLDHLELRVAERTRDLAEANARLQELDRLKSEFLATMSHELRTPLNSIIGFTGILRQELAGPVNEEQKKQLGMVHSSARHLLGLINDLLDLSRIESGKMELFLEDFPVADVVNEVAQSLAPQIEQKKLRFETAIDQPGLRLQSDRKKCFQILLNLANNAVKFTEVGRVTLEVSTQLEALRFAVKDTGIGIKPENMNYLFEAFRQVDGSARRVYEGTGLGLYLSKQLAKMLGGGISVESEFGLGSQFTLTLPLHPPEPTTGHEREDSARRG